MSSRSRDDRGVDYAALAEFRYQLRQFLRSSEDAARGVGLQPQQHQLLLAVKGAPTPDVTIRHLSERMQLRHHSVVELIDRLAERDLVRRRPGAADRRTVCVELTDEGEVVLRALSVHHVKMLADARGLVRALAAVVPARVTRASPSPSARCARSGP